VEKNLSLKEDLKQYEQTYVISNLYVMLIFQPEIVEGCQSYLCPLEQFKKAMLPFSIKTAERQQICHSDILQKIAKGQLLSTLYLSSICQVFVKYLSSIC